ncbi:MAG: peptidase S8 [Burkholderiales bacterium RIFCSPHIGHO2_12_FULL_69_20]|nr:MAG: peptidase S8 [Burkholderiales bacterium RIFCSPHIGHO2_12_FULL_69_20]
MATSVAAQAAQPQEWAKGRLIVQTRAGLSDAELDKVVKVHGGKARRIGKTDLHIVDLPGNASETAVQARLAHNPHLKFAELDGRVSPGFVTNDPYLGSEWHLAKINAAGAWDLSQGQGITIAVLDTGVAPAHPDLAASLVPGWNFYDNNSNTSDVHGHGTAVAGAAAAVSNNAVGVAAIAGAAKIMPIRIADPNAYAYWSTVAQGLTYAADKGARVANISYVGVAGSSSVQSAANYMRSKGGLVVVCAGNNGKDEGLTPTATMIPVSATDSNDLKTSWSSYGNFVAVSAPGINIWTTTVSGGYAQWWGTSIASPITAGTIATMMAANPALSNTQIESLLFSTAVDLGTAGRDALFGHGRVNAHAAVSAARSAVANDTQAPSVAISAPLGNVTVAGLVSVDVNAFDNVGVSRVEFRVNGATVATDTATPFQFSWDSTQSSNGMSNLVAVAYDAAGNSKNSTTVAVNVANNVVVDTTPPAVVIKNPVGGGKVTGTVAISTAASDNNGTATLKQWIYVDGRQVASGTGASLAYSWNTRKAKTGSHTVSAVAQDAAGNKTTTAITVTK